MREFGSDFHFILPGSKSLKTIHDYYPSSNLYADGRQALIHLYKTQAWGNLWIPDYFCHDVIESLKQAGLNLRFYHDSPDCHVDQLTLDSIREKGLFQSNDAVLRVNYFGMRSCRYSSLLQEAAIIEDHTHDLIGEWARNSTADWCIASLRKTLPIPEGGILWSPKGNSLPDPPQVLDDNEGIATIRWNAMVLKSRFLFGDEVEKGQFRSGFLNTESFFDDAPVCSLDGKSQEYLRSFDIQEWYQKKKDNWALLRDIHKEGVRVVEPEGSTCNPFSLVLLFDIPSERDRVKLELINHHVYPAILWSIPCPMKSDTYLFSRRMLSIHCDARYSHEDILQLKSIIESVL